MINEKEEKEIRIGQALRKEVHLIALPSGFLSPAESEIMEDLGLSVAVGSTHKFFVNK